MPDIHQIILEQIEQVRNHAFILTGEQPKYLILSARNHMFLASGINRVGRRIQNFEGMTVVVVDDSYNPGLITVGY